MTPDTLHQGATLGDLFARAAHRFAEREALVAEGKRWTYAELADRVARMGAVLRRQGLRPGDAISILSHNKADVLVAYLAAMVEGLRLTPLAALSSAADQAFILNDAEIDALVIDSALAANAATLQSQAPRLKFVFTLGPTNVAPDLTALTDSEPPQPLEVKPPASDITMIYYTGGTTGRPKGVVHTHSSAMATVMMSGSEWEWPQDLRFLATTPVSHAAGAFAWPTLLKGGTFHALSAFSARAFAEYVAREKITATFLVPTAIYRLLDEPGLDAAQLASLQTIVYGAAPMAPANLAGFQGVSFWTKGDGRSYELMLFATRLGRMPAVKNFTAGPEWTQVTVPFSELSLDGSDILGIFLGGGPALGTFRFQVDEVRLVPKDGS